MASIPSEPRYVDRNKDRPAVHGEPRQMPEALERALHPRTFEELHAEQIHLLNRLQSQEHQTLQLFRRLPTLDEQINYHRNALNCHQHLYQQHHRCRNMNAKVKVKVDGIPLSEGNCQASSEVEWDDEGLQNAQRQRFWLCQQIEGAVDTEGTLLARLSELHVEIQCRERWCRIERERVEMLYASEPRYDGFRPEYTLHQQSQPWKYTHQNPPPQPNPYLYQLMSYGSHDFATRCYQGPSSLPLHPDSPTILPKKGCGMQESHGDSYLPVVQHGGPEKEDWGRSDNMSRLASYANDGGEHVQLLIRYRIKIDADLGHVEEEQYYTREVDRRWASEDMGDTAQGDRPLVSPSDSDTRRWSLPPVHYEVCNLKKHLLLSLVIFNSTGVPARAITVS